MKSNSKMSGSGAVAALVAAAGAAATITYLVYRRRSPAAVIQKCTRAIKCLEEKVLWLAA